MAEDAIKQLLKSNLPIFEQLSQNEQELMLRNTTQVTYKKGTSIHSGDSDCIGLLLIKSGIMRIYILSEEGKEVTLFRLYSGDLCILSASCVLNQITFDVHISAETDCDALLISAPVMAALSKSNMLVENFSYKLTTERFSDVMWTMQQILFMGFDKRLAVFLLDEASKSGSQTIRSTHEQIAKYIGSAREVVTRMLNRFEADGIVKLSRGEINITDKTKLRNIL